MFTLIRIIHTFCQTKASCVNCTALIIVWHRFAFSNSLIMERARKIFAVKAFLFIILLVVYFYLFFLQVVVQYSEKYTNIATNDERVDEIEVPTFTICTGWKESVMKKYGITNLIFSIPPDYETNLPLNYSIRNIFDDVTYKLNKDYFISVGSLLSKPVALEVGMNEIKGQKYQLKQNPARNYGMCYVLFPDQMWMKPFEDNFIITIYRNISSENIDMGKIFLQISSNDTYNTIISEMTGLKNEVQELNFNSTSATRVKVKYTESNMEYIKDCSEMGFFKCWAENLAKTNEFNCTNKCIPILYESLTDSMDQGLPKCANTAEEFCMIGREEYKITMKLKSACLKVSTYIDALCYKDNIWKLGLTYSGHLFCLFLEASNSILLE